MFSSRFRLFPNFLEETFFSGGGWVLSKNKSHFKFFIRFMLFPTLLEKLVLQEGGGGVFVKNKKNLILCFFTFHAIFHKKIRGVGKVFLLKIKRNHFHVFFTFYLIFQHH